MNGDVVLADAVAVGLAIAFPNAWWLLLVLVILVAVNIKGWLP
jgi:hypothetical protein